MTQKINIGDDEDEGGDAGEEWPTVTVTDGADRRETTWATGKRREPPEDDAARRRTENMYAAEMHATTTSPPEAPAAGVAAVNTDTGEIDFDVDAIIEELEQVDGVESVIKGDE